MPTRMRFLLRTMTSAVAVASCVAVQSVHAETIIDEWASVKVPPPPALKPVSIDAKTTALLMVDFNKQTCNSERRPRCIASISKVKPFLAAARAAGVPVVFTLGGGGKPADLPRDLEPIGDEPVFLAGLDKFTGSDLERILKQKGIQTVIIVGSAAHGGIMYTASGAAMRGFKVVVPVDGISADIAYAEQYLAWHLANVPIIASAMTLTTLNDVKF